MSRIPFSPLAGLIALSALSLPANAGGWYVANTAPTETIRYQRVYFSGGTYRFTARAGSPEAGATMHLEVGNAAVLKNVAVPNTGRSDTFAYVHLGTKAISQGHHDLRIVFGSAGISLDWFMLSKDSDTTASVKKSDITMVRPEGSEMLIAPIVAFGHVTASTDGAGALCNYSTDEKLQPFSDAQIEAWFGIPIYRDFDRRSDRYWDNMVDELMASRAQVPLLHCRETKDFTRSLRDRDYQAGPGHFEGRWLAKFAEAVARNPQAAASLKIGMFWENGAIAALFERRNGYHPGWGDPALLDYVMEYHLSPWFDSIPASMLYQPTPGRPIISLFANHPEHIVQDGRMGDFVAGLRGRMNEKYGYDPHFILPAGGDVNAGAEAQGTGQCPWGTWDGPMLTRNFFKGGTWATTCAGSRRRMDTVWLNDWDPATNTGTPASNAHGVDHFRPRIDSEGNSVLLDNFSQAKAAEMKLVQQEGFTNMAEGNGIYRSYHAGWKFPNQHIAAMREFADPATQTAIFEAEACDDYTKVTEDGNSGGSYRKEWYSKGNHLDVYRPLHNLQKWRERSVPEFGKPIHISAGTFDTWGVTSDGKVWARHVTGDPDTWIHVKNAPPLTSVSVSKEYVWGLHGTTVHFTKIPYGWQLNENTSWKQQSGAMVQLSTSTTQVWGVNEKGEVSFRPIDGSGNWTQVEGTMDHVFADDAFVWGMRGSEIFCSRISPLAWVIIPNPHKITALDVGSEEVWGANAGGEIFRRNISGIGGWDRIASHGAPLTGISVGENHVWAMADGIPHCIRMEGFQGAEIMPPIPNHARATDGQATITWTAVSGATGYNLKRSTSSGGPYSVLQGDIFPGTSPVAVTDTVSNGTTYHYVISALTPDGETPDSAEISVTAHASAPEAPSELTAKMRADGTVGLAWKDTAKHKDGFRIERKQDAADFVPIAAVAGNGTTFQDTTALAGFDYTYRVCAYNAAGASGFGNGSSVSTAQHLLNSSGWIVTASANKGGPTANALDGKTETRWSTGTTQLGAEWFQVDMQSTNTIHQIDLWTGTGDYPKSYELHFSMDGEDWGKPITNGSGLRGMTTLRFPPKSARYLRISQVGNLSAWWSINELRVYGKAEP